MDPKAINALLVKVGVNMGDHGQDVTTALAVSPDESVADLVGRALRSQEYRWDAETKAGGTVPIAQPEWRIELRLVTPDAPSGQVI